MNRPLSTSTLTPEAWEPFETCRTTSLLAEKQSSSLVLLTFLALFTHAGSSTNGGGSLSSQNLGSLRGQVPGGADPQVLEEQIL